MTDYLFDEDFLLPSDTARELYFRHAADLPIIDYHNHLPVEEISGNKRYATLTELWLKGDHYKWRGMRALGIPEDHITGTADDAAKFHAWASCVPKMLRNPLFHWTHMELKNPFGIREYLSPANAARIYSKANEQLAQPEFHAAGMLKQFNVKFVGTTDGPCDDLRHHQSCKAQEADLGFTVAPSFRPDAFLFIQRGEAFRGNVNELAACTGSPIRSSEDLLNALKRRIQYFHENGCRISDHGLETLPPVDEWSAAKETDFQRWLVSGDASPFPHAAAFQGMLLKELCLLYHAHGWVQQFHLGAIRNTNRRLVNALGADAGTDSIGDFPQAQSLAAFMNSLEEIDCLTKTILYNLNPADHEVFATMAGNFSSGGTAGKIQHGSAWWFLDQKDGMERQLNSLSNMGILSTFIGMLTDSRSFLSYSRHEYFRRILSALMARDMEKGLIPNDTQWVGEIISKLCYSNAKDYFQLPA